MGIEIFDYRRGITLSWACGAHLSPGVLASSMKNTSRLCRPARLEQAFRKLWRKPGVDACRQRREGRRPRTSSFMLLRWRHGLKAHFDVWRGYFAGRRYFRDDARERRVGCLRHFILCAI